MRDSLELDQLITLQLVVGFLGERDQAAWWDSGFLTSASEAFLSPVFARTTPLARYAGVKEAARRVHDERIGIGRVFHLFHLPESIEQGLFDAMCDPSIADVVLARAASTQSAAMALGELFEVTPTMLEGPVKIGEAKDLTSHRWISAVAAAYRSAFDGGVQCFPYFVET